MGLYKRGQGYWTRMMTAIGGGLIVVLGGAWLWGILEQIRIGEIQPVFIASAGAVLLIAIFGGLLYWLVGVKPRSVDFLIATEGEMKKVNWSTRREIMGSTWVVIALTILVALFIFVVDQLFVRIFAWMRVLDIA